MVSTEVFYKYKGIKTKSSFKYLLDSLRKKYLYFSRPSELNDPFDCYIPKNYVYKSEDELKIYVEIANRNPHRPFDITVDYLKDRLAKKKYAEFDNDVMNHIHILSLSSTWESESMWGKYCDCYNGVCLGYSICNENNKRYLEVTGKIAELFYFENSEHKNKFLDIHEVFYDNLGEEKFNIFQQNHETITYNIFHKKECWKDEKEFRIFVYDNEKKTVRDSKGSLNKIGYPDKVLTEVLFGFHMNSKNKKKIYNLIQRKYSNADNIKFYEVSADVESYCLKRIPYEPNKKY